jgi:CRISPR-associated endonuclease Csn1
VTFGALRKALGIHGERFNFEVGGKKKLRGNATEAVLRKIFGKAWEAHPGRDRLRREIAERLWAVSYKQIGNKRVELRPDADEAAQREHFIQTAQADFGVTLDQAVALVDIGGKLPPGWLRFSRKAVERLLIPLGEGKPITTAQAEVYPTYRDHKKESRERLPSRSTEMPDVRNPTVTRALTELRKVTNNLLAVYGKPGLIRIELARDLKLPKRIRVQIQKQQIDLEALREKAREDLLKNSIPATRESEEKWMLWKECGETCPYTGRKIGFDALFRRGEFQVEHIFPRSRSLDNGFGNKTLCEANLNKEKGNRTPYELFATDPEKWNELKANLRSIGLPESKTRRFLNPRLEAEGSEELAERQLRDTSYIAREARVFLDRLGVPVQPTNGRVTAQLRHVWGLNTILGAAFGGKNRADHRHHAVDALVVALSTPTFIKRLSTYYSREQIAPGDLFPVPWPRMRQEAEAKVGEVVVSHRVRRKVSGALHRQTAYGDTGEEVTENGTTYRFFVSRVKLNGITSAQIGNIRDPVIRQLVDDHVRAHGEKPGGAFPPYPALVSKSDGTTREIRKVRVVFKQQKGLMAKLRPEGQAYADPSANHHIEIFAFGNG